MCGALIPGMPQLIHDCILTHLPPLECDKSDTLAFESRFVDQRPDYPPDDTWMLCGHVHEAWRQHGRVINVGCDVWDYAPVSAQRLVEIIEGRTTT